MKVHIWTLNCNKTVLDKLYEPVFRAFSEPAASTAIDCLDAYIADIPGDHF